MLTERHMTEAADGPKERARRLILDGFGAKRVAQWCEVKPNTVYQWLKRASDAEPFPPRQALIVHRRAAEAGFTFRIETLVPQLAEAA